MKPLEVKQTKSESLSAWSLDSNRSELSFECKSPGETMELGKRWGAILKAGDVVALRGNLGSGKTVFVKGLALGLGIQSKDEVKSPTFVLMHIYPTCIPLYHFDLYRMEDPRDLEAIGLEEWMNDGQAVTCIEWAEKAEALLPKSAYHVRIEILAAEKRKIIFNKNKVIDAE